MFVRQICDVCIANFLFAFLFVLKLREFYQHEKLELYQEIGKTDQSVEG